jgi:ELWxxDGT repeat protein
VYFAADSAGYKGIYKTDGTAAGTSKVFTFNKPNAGVRAIAAGEKFLYVFFIDLDSINVHLWSSNGTVAGSHEVQVLSAQSGYNSVSVIGNTVYFSEFDSTHGMELWKANNNIGSAKMVKDIFPGLDNAYPNNFVNYNGKLYFTADDSLYTTFIYVSDGTKAGTKRIIRGEGPIITSNNKLFFTGYNTEVGDELFISDGTTAGTTLLKDIIEGQPSSYPYAYIVMNNIVYFTAASDLYGYELWKTDGTTNGTVVVKDIIPGANGSSPFGLTVAGNKLYFRASNDSYQQMLFVSNGKAAGTKPVVDSGLQGVTINSFTGAGDKLFINGYTNAFGNELYAGPNTGFVPVVNNATAKKIQENKTLSAIVLGNPVQHELNLSIQTVKEQSAQIIISDASGKVLVNERALLTAGTNNVAYPAGSWASGIYNVKITANDGFSTVLKIVK